MASLPHFWQPQCPHCDDRATNRLALGDASGPFMKEVGTVRCESCGKAVALDASAAWLPFPVDPAPRERGPAYEPPRAAPRAHPAAPRGPAGPRPR